MNVRFSGVTINQPDLPHWATDVLQWLGMVQGMQSASGKIGNTYRELVKQVVDGSGDPFPYDNPKTGKRTWLTGPAAVYGIYQSFCAALEMEANR